MSNHPPFDDPHKSPEDFWRHYPGTEPMHRRSSDRPTVTCLGELSHITDDLDAAIDRASLPVPGCARDDLTPEQYLDSLGPPKRDTTPCEAVTAPPPRDTLPAEAMADEPKEDLRSMLKRLEQKVDDLAGDVGTIKTRQAEIMTIVHKGANLELQVHANRDAIASLPCRQPPRCPVDSVLDEAAE